VGAEKKLRCWNSLCYIRCGIDFMAGCRGWRERGSCLPLSKRKPSLCLGGNGSGVSGCCSWGGGTVGARFWPFRQGRDREAATGMQVSKQDPFGREGSRSRLQVTRSHVHLWCQTCCCCRETVWFRKIWSRQKREPFGRRVVAWEFAEAGAHSQKKKREQHHVRSRRPADGWG
jgi:hypothetical protein